MRPSMTTAAAALACASLFAQEAPPPTSYPSASFTPRVGLVDAVAAAERDARERTINLSGQHIRHAELRYDDTAGRKDHYWLIQWAWSQPRLGGEYGARVYMDGTVVPQRCGP